MTLPDFASVVLGPGDFLLLRPKERITTATADLLRSQIPDELRGRVLIVDDSIDVVVGRPVGGS